MKRLATFLASLIATIAWIMVMRKLTAPLDSSDILRFEFIGTAAKAEEFLRDLPAGHIVLLTRSIYLDMVFPLLYGLTLWTANRWAWPETRLPETKGKSVTAHFIARFALWATLAAIASDYVENAAMLNMISTGPMDTAASAAWWFASLKFSLIVLLLILFLCGLLLRLIRSSGKTLRS